MADTDLDATRPSPRRSEAVSGATFGDRTERIPVLPRDQIPKSNVVKLTETGNYSMTNAAITFDYGRAFVYIALI